MIKNLSKVKCKKLVCFTVSKYPYPYCFQVKECQAVGVVSNMLGKTLSEKWKFERFFDYVGWLNDSSVDAEDFRIGE